VTLNIPSKEEEMNRWVKGKKNWVKKWKKAS